MVNFFIFFLLFISEFGVIKIMYIFFKFEMKSVYLILCVVFRFNYYFFLKKKWDKVGFDVCFYIRKGEGMCLY